MAKKESSPTIAEFDDLMNRIQRSNLLFREFLLPAIIYVVIAVFFLLKLLMSGGDAAQQDWGIPLTTNAALRDFNSRLFAWDYNGFGSPALFWGFPFFTLTNAVLAPLGFVGGVEIKFLSVFLVALGGLMAYLLARSFRLGKFSSFLAGLFYMSTPLMFNWLMFGWIFYLLSYDLLPLFILLTKKFIETNDFRYALVDGLILGVATIQPTFILIFPLIGFLFVLFESKGCWRVIRRGITFCLVSLGVWGLTALSFFTSQANGDALNAYYGNYFNAIQWQFQNLTNLLNPIRLWGSTMNFQFGTYYPTELIFSSFIPVVIASVALLLQPRNRRILFFSVLYLLVLFAYLVTSNLSFFVYNIPYGAIFQAPSIFLVPASVGLALLIAYANDAISVLSVRLRRVLSPRLFKHLLFAVALVLVVLAGFPWWSGQVSGEPIGGAPTKLNLYSIPAGYKEWNNIVQADDNYFVLYLPLRTNVRMLDQNFFSDRYEGVNMGIFSEVNNLPYISAENTSLLLHELVDNVSQVAEEWGVLSIKYVVVYKDVNSTYNIDNLWGLLCGQKGLREAANLPGVVVFENEFAVPVVYTDTADANVDMTYHDPTTFKLEVNSSGPFTLVLNQAYSANWQVKVNGSVLPDSSHLNGTNCFNSWAISKVGTYSIELFYEPQTVYLVSEIISAVVIIVIIAYLFVASAGSLKKSRFKNNLTFST